MTDTQHPTIDTLETAEPYLREAETQLLQAYRVLATASADGNMRVDRLCSKTFTAWNLVNSVMQEASKMKDKD